MSHISDLYCTRVTFRGSRLYWFINGETRLDTSAFLLPSKCFMKTPSNNDLLHLKLDLISQRQNLVFLSKSNFFPPCIQLYCHLNIELAWWTGDHLTNMVMSLQMWPRDFNKKMCVICKKNRRSSWTKFKSLSKHRAFNPCRLLMGHFNSASGILAVVILGIVVSTQITFTQACEHATRRATLSLWPLDYSSESRQKMGETVSSRLTVQLVSAGWILVIGLPPQPQVHIWIWPGKAFCSRKNQELLIRHEEKRHVSFPLL